MHSISVQTLTSLADHCSNSQLQNTFFLLGLLQLLGTLPWLQWDTYSITQDRVSFEVCRECKVGFYAFAKGWFLVASDDLRKHWVHLFVFCRWVLGIKRGNKKVSETRYRWERGHGVNSSLYHILMLFQLLLSTDLHHCHRMALCRHPRRYF